MAARLVVLGLLVAGCQCWKLPVVNQGRRAQYYTQQNDGSYHYGFDTAEGLYQSQQADQANEVSGQFGADGGKVEYTAGVDGFVVTALKKPDATATKSYVYKTPVRYATLEELATHPEQVDDTPEVKAAKATFQANYDAAAAAAAAAPDVNIITGASPAVSAATYSAPAPQAYYLAPTPVEIKYYGPSAPVDASGNVVDTAEVRAAKATFQANYDAAAAAAEAAPDVNIITGASPAVSAATYSAPAPQAYYLAPTPVEIKYYGPSAPVDASGNVVDTAEVRAAKATFQANYDAAAAAAEAAPDVNIITAPVQAPVAVPVITTYGSNSKPSEIVDFRSTSNDDGSYEFSYITSDSSRYESADAANNVQGNYEFVADDAQTRRVEYRAGAETGFVASGAHLPVSVQDTAAVASAKASFKSAFESAAAAAKAASNDEINTGYAYTPAVAINTATYSAPAPQTAYLAPTPQDIKYYGPSAPVDASGHVVDTAEVRAAKASFQAAYDTAAAAAAAAPDVNIITGAVPAVSAATYSAPAPQHSYLAPTPQDIKYYGPSAPVDASGHVVDTAEVRAAKATFQAAYDAAAAAAAAAPDVNIITGAVPAVSAATYSAPAPQHSYLAPTPQDIKYYGPSAPVDASGHVVDTAEVRAAKATFQAAYDAAAAAAAAAPDVNIITGAVPAVSAATYSAPAPQHSYLAPTPQDIKYYGPSAPVDASGHVVDTAEVRAAKATFQAAYDAAAAAAAAAPDVNIITGAVPAVSAATYSAPALQHSYLAPAPVEIKYSGPAAPLDASGRVKDTAEVRAAKATFQAAYDAAAAAAVAAPDNGIITASVQTPGAVYSAAAVPVSQTTYSASHGNMRTISFDGITLMQVDGGPNVFKFGYSYE